MFEFVLYDHGLEEAVTAMVRSGFYSEDEIADFFREIADDDPESGLDPSTVDEEVRRLFTVAASAHRLASKNWPEKTDNDRLTEAFCYLNKGGIRAIENYGYEASDCDELYRDIRGERQWRGYCFYHNQDLVRAVMGSGLAIRFSAAVDRPGDVQNRAIAEEIVRTLKSCGLQPEWNGDPRNVIVLALVWRRRQVPT